MIFRGFLVALSIPLLNCGAPACPASRARATDGTCVRQDIVDFIACINNVGGKELSAEHKREISASASEATATAGWSDTVRERYAGPAKEQQSKVIDQCIRMADAPKNAPPRSFDGYWIARDPSKSEGDDNFLACVKFSTDDSGTSSSRYAAYTRAWTKLEGTFVPLGDGLEATTGPFRGVLKRTSPKDAALSIDSNTKVSFTEVTETTCVDRATNSLAKDTYAGESKEYAASEDESRLLLTTLVNVLSKDPNEALLKSTWPYRRKPALLSGTIVSNGNLGTTISTGSRHTILCEAKYRANFTPLQRGDAVRLRGKFTAAIKEGSEWTLIFAECVLLPP